MGDWHCLEVLAGEREEMVTVTFWEFGSEKGLMGDCHRLGVWRRKEENR
jgi:hypothetical protein